MDQQKAGRFLKELRHEKGMTQEQLAQVFKVSSRTISRWENGTNLPDISLLVEIADFKMVYGKKEVDELCRNAGLKMETFEKRGFCRLHCVAKKVG